MPSSPLPPAQLYRRCDPDAFDFETTAQLEELPQVLGQQRAIDAVRFGIGIRREGFNMFAMGPQGIGKHTLVRHFAEEKAATESPASDWCYVNDFDQPQKPRTLQLPPGVGVRLRDDVERLLTDFHSAIPSVFESEEYRTRRQVIEEELKEKQEAQLDELRQEAERRGIALLRTPVGLAFAPVKDGKVLGQEEFQQLPQTEQQRVETEVGELQGRLRSIIRQVPQLDKAHREKLKQLNDEVSVFVVGHLVDELRKKYASLPQIIDYLDAMQRDVIDNVDSFITPPEASFAASMGLPQPRSLKDSVLLRRYRINAIVDNSSNNGAPVVYEDNPTFQKLVGEIEHLAQMGALVTDFNLIRAGALHRANGGYLIVDAHKILVNPFAWEGLKRALRSSELRVESPGQMMSLVSTASLEPQPIPLNVKVILVGERLLYYLLCEFDPEFNGLFKVAVDFEEEITRSDDLHHLYARLIGTIAKEDELLPFDRGAVARVIEHSARVAGDAEKLSTNMGSLADLLREADHWASRGNRASVTAVDVQQAIDATIHRADRIRAKIHEDIKRGTILIDTNGAVAGQVNGLSVITMGGFAFGRPSRITARARMGKGEVIDIEREVELGGPIHSKGVLILSSFLGARYSAELPLSLSASLVFEQSYGGVEGDSASSAELYALLSELSQVPVKQSFAVTGSVNQNGQVQAIGGVNEKIEGFFDVCSERGLTGEQGVLIPESNVKHLMLKREVVEAVEAGRFHVYAVSTIDEGIEILTGVPAGRRDEAGRFPENSVNARVQSRLEGLARRRIELTRPLQEG